MDIYSKYPDLSGNKIKFLIFLLVVSGFIFAEISFFNVSSQKNEDDCFAVGEEIILLNGNTLLPFSASPVAEARITRKMPVIVTAYSSTPWETWGDPYLTASETWVRDGIIANNLLPFGTQVRIPEIYGNKIFIVEDRMHSRKGNYHFDIWFPSNLEAKEFGVKRTYIEVLEG